MKEVFLNNSSGYSHLLAISCVIGYLALLMNRTANQWMTVDKIKHTISEGNDRVEGDSCRKGK